MAKDVHGRGPAAERVAANVESLRKRQSMTLKGLSERMGELGQPVSLNGLSKVENGERRVDVDELIALAIALRVNPSTLLLPDLGDTEQVALTPTLTHEAWAVWQWADGIAPLPTSYGDEYNTHDELDDFREIARPGAVTDRKLHPLLNVTTGVYNHVHRMIAAGITESRLKAARTYIDRVSTELDELETEINNPKEGRRHGQR